MSTDRQSGADVPAPGKMADAWVEVTASPSMDALPLPEDADELERIKADERRRKRQGFGFGADLDA